MEDFPNLSLDLPDSFNDLSLEVPEMTDALRQVLTDSGSLKDGNIVINSRTGLVTEDAEVKSMDDLIDLKALGAGSGGVVRLVQHRETGKLYALKEMQLSIDKQERQQMKELEINGTPRGHVVKCYQTFYGDGLISIVLEYMDGGSLADIVAIHKKIPERYLAEIARQTLEGLYSLHKDHIIHRDIKPSNILVNREGLIKITDFGVSTMLINTADVAHTAAGTYTYMSPERISGEEYSYNSDMWALGLSILECAMGHFPYIHPKRGKWNSYFELLNTVVRKPAPKASPKEFSEEFCSFISSCLQKDASKRPTAAQALEHPFILKYKDTDNNLGQLCAT